MAAAHVRLAPVLVTAALCLLLPLSTVPSLCRDEERPPIKGVRQADANTVETGDEAEVFYGGNMPQLLKSHVGEPQRSGSERRRKRLSRAVVTDARLPRKRLLTRRSSAKLLVAVTLTAAAALMFRKLSNVIWMCLVKTGRFQGAGLSPRLLSIRGEDVDGGQETDICPDSDDGEGDVHASGGIFDSEAERFLERGEGEGVGHQRVNSDPGSDRGDYIIPLISLLLIIVALSLPSSLQPPPSEPRKELVTILGEGTPDAGDSPVVVRIGGEAYMVYFSRETTASLKALGLTKHMKRILKIVAGTPNRNDPPSAWNYQEHGYPSVPYHHTRVNNTDYNILVSGRTAAQLSGIPTGEEIKRVLEVLAKASIKAYVSGE